MIVAAFCTFLSLFIIIFVAAILSYFLLKNKNYEN
jgi:uncharacterized BrkB/YihY/UPF0761 family membrane protein